MKNKQPLIQPKELLPYINYELTKEIIFIKISSIGKQNLQKIRNSMQYDTQFLLSQALTCAQAGARLITPFIGRILDCFTKIKVVMIILNKIFQVQNQQLIYGIVLKNSNILITNLYDCYRSITTFGR
ncbi:unnamed protein product [Paramecium sonneborni]|uniref:Transaldolase n=1 Tax=Paramecium sonneborni TaxID=65129 RepID=A0A8S1RNJ2_9CILI|nr:unnamed protein product [Paramecium sonneborni]